MTTHWVCLDVGETLIDETRLWTCWAQVLGLTPLTLHAALGAAIVQGLGHQDAFELAGRRGWRTKRAEFEQTYGGFAPTDLHSDALPAITALREAGYGVAVIGNQPAHRQAELERVGVRPDVMAMSEELGADKPAPAFFTAALERMGAPPPAAVAYVGDRVDNDVVPAARAGLRAIWLRRGPWGALQQDPDGHADLVLDSLDGLVDQLATLWIQAP